MKAGRNPTLRVGGKWQEAPSGHPVPRCVCTIALCTPLYFTQSVLSLANSRTPYRLYQPRNPCIFHSLSGMVPLSSKSDACMGRMTTAEVHEAAKRQRRRMCAIVSACTPLLWFCDGSPSFMCVCVCVCVCMCARGGRVLPVTTGGTLMGMRILLQRHYHTNCSPLCSQ